MFFRIALHIAFIAVLLTVVISWRHLGPVKEVTLVVDGAASMVETRQMRVSAVLAEAGVEVSPYDEVLPPKDALVASGGRIALARAVDVKVLADGRLVQLQTTALTVGEALEAGGITLRPFDGLSVNGRPISLETMLRSLGDAPRAAKLPQKVRWWGDSMMPWLSVSPGYVSLSPQLPPRPAPVTLSVQRAVPLYLREQGLPTELFSLKDTVGESLAEAGVKVYPGDLVVPSIDTRVRAGMNIYLYRAKDATVIADGGERRVRTLAGTVGELLEQQSVTLGPLDRLEPRPGAPVRDNLTVKIVRVREAEETLEEAISFRILYNPNYDMELDEQRLIQLGRPGLRKTVYRVRYEDGEEVKRVKEQERVEAEPVDTIIQYGAKIVLRTLETPEGPMQYWRKMRVFATWYDASHGGKPKGSPGYGITALGLKATIGVIAVDPKVIPFYTRMYVPGYGTGVAGDTGGAIKGRIIDLAFDEDASKTWGTKWTDIYILTPVPPPDKILWILP